MKHIDYQTQGTCSHCIHLDLTDDGRIASLALTAAAMAICKALEHW